jgi:hypothetical protein
MRAYFDAQRWIVLSEHDVMNGAPPPLLTSRREVAIHQ